MWKIKDFVDLEYFFYLDKQENDDVLEKRDRSIYLKNISQQVLSEDKGKKIKKWLEIRRENEKKENLKELSVFPGQKLLYQT